MRRTQFYVDDDIYEALSAKAARLRTSRSAIVRDAVRAFLPQHFADSPDPIDELAGSVVDVDAVDDIDGVIYDQGRSALRDPGSALPDGKAEG